MKVNIRYRKKRGQYEAYYLNRSTGKRVTKSLGTADYRAAQKAVVAWELEIEQGSGSKAIGWLELRERFEDEHLAGKPDNTRMSYSGPMNHFEKLHGTPLDLNSITGSTMSAFTSKLRQSGLGDERIGGVLRHLRAVFRFGVRIGAMKACPPFSVPKVVKRKLWRSRAIADDEFADLIAAAPKVVGKKHAQGWQRLLRGLWLSGLRINEAIALSWDCPPLQVMMGTRPTLVIFGEGQKSREDEILPLTPDFAAMLQETPAKERRGPVFPLTHSKWKVYRETACRVIGDIGREAGIQVDAAGKHLTAHDLRRAFGQRWAMRVKPLILMKLMRHKSLTTTMRFYIGIEDSDVSDAIWQPAWQPKNSGRTKTPAKRPSKTGRK